MPDLMLRSVAAREEPDLALPQARCDASRSMGSGPPSSFETLGAHSSRVERLRIEMRAELLWMRAESTATRISG
jgi:hypothetical protein